MLDWAVFREIEHPSKARLKSQRLIIDLERKPVDPAGDMDPGAKIADLEGFFVQGYRQAFARAECLEIFNAPGVIGNHMGREGR